MDCTMRCRRLVPARTDQYFLELCLADKGTRVGLDNGLDKGTLEAVVAAGVDVPRGWPCCDRTAEMDGTMRCQRLELASTDQYFLELRYSDRTPEPDWTRGRQRLCVVPASLDVPRGWLCCDRTPEMDGTLRCRRLVPACSKHACPVVAVAVF